MNRNLITLKILIPHATSSLFLLDSLPLVFCTDTPFLGACFLLVILLDHHDESRGNCLKTSACNEDGWMDESFNNDLMRSGIHPQLHNSANVLAWKYVLHICVACTKESHGTDIRLAIDYSYRSTCMALVACKYSYDVRYSPHTCFLMSTIFAVFFPNYIEEDQINFTLENWELRHADVFRWNGRQHCSWLSI